MPSMSQRVMFAGSQGTDLAARLDLPAGPVRANAVFAHCFTCSKDIHAAGRIAAGLNAAGFAVLRFDFTGLGSSEGEFANTDFSSNLDDLRLAAGWLASERSAPQLLVGHSLGGAAVLSVAGEMPTVRAVATIGAPATTTHLRQLFTGSIETIERDGRAEVSIGGRPFTIRRELLDDLELHSVSERASNLRAALMVLHSPTDNVVGIENAAEIYQAARHPKSFVALDGADHLISDRRDATYAATMIAAWAGRYVVDEHPPAPDPFGRGQAVVGETTQGKFLNHVIAGRHHFLADEPEDVGGFDAGPSPFDLLSSGLGACTSMTLRMYADRKALPLERIVVEVDHHKVNPPPEDGKVDVFERRIHLTGDLTETDRQSLLSIANRCPVHLTLERSSHIETSVVE